MAALTGLASGRPQWIDVSAQEVVMIASMCAPATCAKTGARGSRRGANIGRTKEIWPCKDGFVSFGLRGGKARVPSLRTITRLVDEAGLATPALTERDWEHYSPASASDEELAAIEEPIASYFASRTMDELYEAACETNLMLAPANMPAQIDSSAQLAARKMFGTLGDIDRFPLRFVLVRSHDGEAGPATAQAPAPALGSLGNVDDARAAWPARPASGQERPRCGHCLRRRDGGLAGHQDPRVRLGRRRSDSHALLRRARRDGGAHRVPEPSGLPACLCDGPREPPRHGRLDPLRRPQSGQALHHLEPEEQGRAPRGASAGSVGRRRVRELRSSGNGRLRPRLRHSRGREAGPGDDQRVPERPDRASQGLPGVRRPGVGAVGVQRPHRVARQGAGRALRHHHRLAGPPLRGYGACRRSALQASHRAGRLSGPLPGRGGDIHPLAVAAPVHGERPLLPRGSGTVRSAPRPTAPFPARGTTGGLRSPCGATRNGQRCPS